MSIKKMIKKIVYRNRLFEKLYKCISRRNTRKGYKIYNRGYGRFCTDVIGKDNTISIGENSFLRDTTFRIRGNNNTIIIEGNCSIGSGCSFWIEGNNSRILVGKYTTFTQYVHLNAQENNIYISIGEDCMFSNNIIVRTSDSHPIYNLESGERINIANSVEIGNHVWIAPNSKIMKGAVVGTGSIVGSDTMVTKKMPCNTLIVGHPARVVRENVNWTREKLF